MQEQMQLELQKLRIQQEKQIANTQAERESAEIIRLREQVKALKAGQ